MKIATVEEMRELDRRAIDEFGVPDEILMENAGEAVYYALLSETGVADTRFAVICGAGNNGGDGLVVARKIRSSGGSVRVLLLGGEDRFGGAARYHLDMLARSGAPIERDATPRRVAGAVREADIVIDGIFGTGIGRDVEGRYREVIETINASGRPVMSIDIPSGIDGNNGSIRGVAVDADWTVTFGLPKRGNLLHPGAARCGKLFLTHISFPPELHRDAPIALELNDLPALPPRRPDGHKGTFGDVLFVAGAASYYGAPSYAALSLLRAGGGYARLAAPRSVVPALANLAGEAVFVPQDETAAGTLALSAADGLLALAREVDLVVAGPGISLDEETARLVRRLAAEIERPLLVDGDGLTAVAADLDCLRGRAHPTVLTPHPGEMSRLTGRPVSEIISDPVEAVRSAARDLRAVVVLKISRSLIADPDGHVWINPSGNSGMGTAGSGDVLTGTIAAMHGLGLPIVEAVRAGVFVHGLAGDLAADAVGQDGMTARDVLGHLPAAVRTYRKDHADLAEGSYGVVELL